MTNTKPTWEEEYKKYKTMTVDVGLKRMAYIYNPYYDSILKLIQKVERDAYERGYDDASKIDLKIDMKNYLKWVEKVNYKNTLT